VYLGGIIVFGANLVMTVVILIAAGLFWRAGCFTNVEEPKYRMMQDNEDHRARWKANDEGRPPLFPSLVVSPSSD